MATVEVKSDAERVTVSLTRFALAVDVKEQLLRTIGLGQLQSVRKTFREGGSPSGSWRPLSPVSLRWNKYSAGHKLLINRGLLLNSITFAVQGSAVIIGTGLSYAEVHQKGFDGTQSVKPYSYTRRVRSQDKFSTEQVTNKAGRRQSVKRKVSSGITTVNVRGFSRHIRILARPFLVFRPEDPARIQQIAETFVASAAKQSGLDVDGGSR